MGLKTLLKLLDDVEAGKNVDETTLPCFRTVFEAMTQHPAETRTYMHERQTKRFAKRADISEHTERFAAVLGLLVSHVTNATQQLGVYSRRTQDSLDREQAIELTYQDRLMKLKAVVDVIQGYGAVTEIAGNCGITYKALYNNVQRHLDDTGIVLQDLKAMSTPRRKALGDRVLRKGEAALDEYLRDKVKGDGEYRKTLP